MPKTKKNNLTAFDRIKKRIKPATKLHVDIHFVIIEKLFKKENPKSEKKHNELHDFIGIIMADIDKELSKYQILLKNGKEKKLQ